ncbi:hypothetical protein P8R33_04210 [Qipengyuania sp. XHP0211]|uniref:hypothetical protein n=1 Tax=Qipengyuania sp. XHP0211 TaxID=3038079 RepID=UPI00241DFD13|nr:hypothetical protein [Qipengyuania sp. XHP0211]MDG5750304.1 hypothetical protein [Qipengyuania sp. XHP0211]
MPVTELGELLLQAGGEGGKRVPIDAVLLVSALRFEQIDLFIERGALRLVARKALFEILVPGIDEACLDRFEESLNGGFGCGALIEQRDDVALALRIDTS